MWKHCLSSIFMLGGDVCIWMRKFNALGKRDFYDEKCDNIIIAKSTFIAMPALAIWLPSEN